MLKIDSIQLLRNVYKTSLRDKTNDKPDSIDLLWLLGDVSGVHPPLLHHVNIVIKDYESFTVEFIHQNLSIDSKSPSQWIDGITKQRFDFGTMFILALQAQTGVTDSYQTAALGTVYSSLWFKDYVSVMNDPDCTSDPSYYAPLNYDCSVMTPVSRINDTKSINMDSSLMLCCLFKISLSDAVKHNIVVRGRHIHTDFIYRLDLRHRVLCRKPNSKLSIRSSSVSLPPDSSTHSSRLLETLNSIQLNLLQPNTIIKTDRSLSHQMIALIDRHILHDEQTRQEVKCNQNSDTHKKHPQVKSRFDKTGEENLQSIKPPTSISDPSKQPFYKQIKPQSLFEVLVRRKWKPIIVVPSTSSFTSCIINFSNIREFLENRIIRRLSMSDQQDDAEEDLHRTHFTWKVDLPLLKKFGQSSDEIEFKIVDDHELRNFKQNDWFRIVAVVVKGPDWQFQSWPFHNLTSLFNCISGIYFSFDGDTVLPSIVTNHPIDVLRLKRATRHADSIVWSQFVVNISNVLLKPRDFSQFDKSKLGT